LDRTGATVEARVLASLGDSEVGTGVLKRAEEEGSLKKIVQKALLLAFACNVYDKAINRRYDTPIPVTASS